MQAGQENKPIYKSVYVYLYLNIFWSRRVCNKFCECRLHYEDRGTWNQAIYSALLGAIQNAFTTWPETIEAHK